MKSKASKSSQRLAYSALCLALGLVLPFLTGQIPEIGQMLSPMHIPVLLCGFVCGWPWGMAVGATVPILRGILWGMPPLFPAGIGMMFELAAYGASAGILYRLMPKNIVGIYATLIPSMIIGRIVWGCAQVVLMGVQGKAFTFAAFIAGAITSAIPGIILHIILIPIIVLALQRAKLILNE